MKILVKLFFVLFFFVSPHVFSSIRLIVHGGSGSLKSGDLTQEQEKEHINVMNAALQAGYSVLNSNGKSIDAVKAAINVMEDSPLFNAGKGSVFTANGDIELDAELMDGNTQKLGAITGSKHIKNPVNAAYSVLKKSPYVFLSGSGTDDFAKKEDIRLVSNKYFFTESRWIQHLNDLKSKNNNYKYNNLMKSEQGHKYGTVGAVALDVHGDLAAGTSTGGILNKKFGRIGDSPLIGAGTYANNTEIAVSSTGEGEYFIRTVAAYDVFSRMKYAGDSVYEAVRKTLYSIKLLGGEGDDCFR